MAEPETFWHDGPWITSSEGFKVRSLGRSGMEYVSGSLTLNLASESLATQGFVLYPRDMPEKVPERVLADVTRAWRWAGFDVETIRP